MSLKLTCKQVAALLIAREDQLISLPEDVALKLHLLACSTCPKFETQVLTMRSAMNRWRNYTGDEDSTPDGTK
jgi:hypothetical protein